MTFRYKIKSMMNNSNKYGTCEICKKECSEVYYQTEERRFRNPIENIYGWTTHKCKNYFGHKKCLLNIRRKYETTK